MTDSRLRSRQRLCASRGSHEFLGKLCRVCREPKGELVVRADYWAGYFKGTLLPLRVRGSDGRHRPLQFSRGVIARFVSDLRQIQLLEEYRLRHTNGFRRAGQRPTRRRP